MAEVKLSLYKNATDLNKIFVLNVLTQPMTVSEVSKKTGFSYSLTYKLLNELVKSGLVAKVKSYPCFYYIRS